MVYFLVPTRVMSHTLDSSANSTGVRITETDLIHDGNGHSIASHY